MNPIKYSPFDPTLIADPLPADLAKLNMGDTRIKPTEAVRKLNLALLPWMWAVGDRIVERRQMTFKSMQEVIRWCVGFGLRHLAQAIDSQEIDLSIAHANQVRAFVAEVLEARTFRREAQAARGALQMLLEDESYRSAVALAHVAYRGYRDISKPEKQSQYVSLMYGGNGNGIPPEAEWDAAAQLWHKVYNQMPGFVTSEDDDLDDAVRIHDTSAE